jgi:hypothetical protein
MSEVKLPHRSGPQEALCHPPGPLLADRDCFARRSPVSRSQEDQRSEGLPKPHRRRSGPKRGPGRSPRTSFGMNQKGVPPGTPARSPRHYPACRRGSKRGLGSRIRRRAQSHSGDLCSAWFARVLLDRPAGPASGPRRPTLAGRHQRTAPVGIYGGVARIIRAAPPWVLPSRTRA